jgi:hypothetical protein
MPEIRELVHLHVKEDSIAAAKLRALNLPGNISYRDYMAQLLEDAMQLDFKNYYAYLESVEARERASEKEYSVLPKDGRK